MAPLFICLSLPGPVRCKLGQPGVLFVLPEVLTPVLGPWTFFCCIFAGFSLLCLLATAILDSFSLFYLPNRNCYILSVNYKTGLKSDNEGDEKNDTGLKVWNMVSLVAQQ